MLDKNIESSTKYTFDTIRLTNSLETAFSGKQQKGIN